MQQQQQKLRISKTYKTLYEMRSNAIIVFLIEAAYILLRCAHIGEGKIFYNNPPDSDLSELSAASLHLASGPKIPVYIRNRPLYNNISLHVFIIVMMFFQMVWCHHGCHLGCTLSNNVISRHREAKRRKRRKKRKEKEENIHTNHMINVVM